MELKKKVKCNHCGTVIEEREGVAQNCGCGAVQLTESVVTAGVPGVDYTDVSPKLIFG